MSKERFWKVFKDVTPAFVKAEKAEINAQGDLLFYERGGALVRGFKSNVWVTFHRDDASFELCYQACEEMTQEDRALLLEHLQKHFQAEGR
jgi:hypothetical protein